MWDRVEAAGFSGRADMPSVAVGSSRSGTSWRDVPVKQCDTVPHVLGRNAFKV